MPAVALSGYAVLKTRVYIDGFNLYYGLLRGTPHKWLDLELPLARGKAN
jgi:hypothetical protein